MNSAEEYLNRTESAVIKIFEGINSYSKILSNSARPIYLGDFGDTKDQRDAYNTWISTNENSLQLSIEAQRQFLAEDFALATLCGSLLQIAAMGIQWFSKNENLSEDLHQDLYSAVKSIRSARTREKVLKFCIGRRIRGVPIGLAIYASRNQFNHMDDKDLREPNVSIFKLLACNYTTDKGEIPKDPAFDLESETLNNFSSNATALFGWKSYASYYSDMYSLIVAV